jgi:predicted PurR-regulated permease PerM
MDTVAPDPNQAAFSQPPAARQGFAITITVRSMWMAMLIALTILVAIFVLMRAQGPIVLLVLSIILAEAIRSFVARLKRYHIPRPLAVLLIYLVVLLVIGVLIWLLLSPLVGAVDAFTRSLPQYLRQLLDDLHRLEQGLRVQGSVNAALDSLAHSLATFLQNSIPMLIAVPFKALSGLFMLIIDLVVVLTMTLFWLMSTAKVKPFVVGLFPVQSQEHASLVTSEIGKSFGGYVRGLLISMVLIGIITGLGLTILGVPYALLLGAFAGLTALPPDIGPWISGTVAVGVALVAVDPAKALEAIILFCLIFIVEGEVVQPLVMSRSGNLDPLPVIVAVLIGLRLLGWSARFSRCRSPLAYKYCFCASWFLRSAVCPISPTRRGKRLLRIRSMHLPAQRTLVRSGYTDRVTK